MIKIIDYRLKSPEMNILKQLQKSRKKSKKQQQNHEENQKTT